MHLHRTGSLSPSALTLNRACASKTPQCRWLTQQHSGALQEPVFRNNKRESACLAAFRLSLPSQSPGVPSLLAQAKAMQQRLSHPPVPWKEMGVRCSVVGICGLEMLGSPPPWGGAPGTSSAGAVWKP